MLKGVSQHPESKYFKIHWQRLWARKRVTHNTDEINLQNLLIGNYENSNDT